MPATRAVRKRRFTLQDHLDCGQLLQQAEQALWDVLERALQAYPAPDLEALERLIKDRGAIWRVRNRLDTHFWQEVARGDLPRPKVMGTSPYYPDPDLRPLPGAAEPEEDDPDY
jgi:hypothetical protein